MHSRLWRQSLWSASRLNDICFEVAPILTGQLWCNCWQKNGQRGQPLLTVNHFSRRLIIFLDQNNASKEILFILGLVNIEVIKVIKQIASLFLRPCIGTLEGRNLIIEIGTEYLSQRVFRAFDFGAHLYAPPVFYHGRDMSGRQQ